MPTSLGVGTAFLWTLLSSSVCPEDTIFSPGVNPQDYGARKRQSLDGTQHFDSKALWFLFDLTSWNSCLCGRIAVSCFPGPVFAQTVLSVLQHPPPCSSSFLLLSPSPCLMPLALSCLLPVPDHLGSSGTQAHSCFPDPVRKGSSALRLPVKRLNPFMATELTQGQQLLLVILFEVVGIF